jgi:hypothetical protein
MMMKCGHGILRMAFFRCEIPVEIRLPIRVLSYY